MSEPIYIYIAEIGHGGFDDNPPPYEETVGTYSSLEKALIKLQEYIRNDIYDETDNELPDEDGPYYYSDVTTETELEDWCTKFDSILVDENQYYRERFNKSYFYTSAYYDKYYKWGWNITKRLLDD